MGFREDLTWIGAGTTPRGFGPLGADLFEGIARRTESPDARWREVYVTNPPLGSTPAGAPGLSLFVGFNMATLELGGGLQVTDLGLTAAATEVEAALTDLAWGLRLARFVEGPEFLATLFMRELEQIGPLGRLLTFAAWLHTTAERHGYGGIDEPAVVVMSVPGIGSTAERPVFGLAGELVVGSRVE